MKSAAGSGNLERFYECDLKFHRTVWKLGNNRYAIQFLENIVAPLFGFYVMRTYRNAKQLSHEVEIHRAILDAIPLETPSQARQVMREKLHYYLRALVKLFVKLVVTLLRGVHPYRIRTARGARLRRSRAHVLDPF
jgi:DNA-binding GntR family transcriptional regulator